METSDWVVIFSAGLSLIASIIAIFVSTNLAIKKERRQMRYSHELQNINAVTELAGELVEVIGGYGKNHDKHIARLEELDLLGGRLGKYTDLRQKIRDLSHNLKNQVNLTKNHDKEEIEFRKKLDPLYKELVEESKKAIETI